MARTRSFEYRQYKRARERVLTRLAQAHPDEYQRLLQEERANELEKDTRASDTSLVTSSVGIRAAASTAQSPSNYYAEDAGDNGGEA